jgi:hypothetical protein
MFFSSKVTTTTAVGPPITPELLTAVAGSATVQVEKRISIHANFGQNRTPEHQVSMTVSDLVSRLLQTTNNSEKDDGKHHAESDTDTIPSHPSGQYYYLSTQEAEEEKSVSSPIPTTTTINRSKKQKRHGPVFATPCRQLLHQQYIPATVPWAGPHLDLQSCNLWMGAASSSSSGLHHDFHDNWYILCSGTKIFRLWAPSDFAAMELYGTVERVHENGLISYDGHPLRSDGAPLLLLRDLVEPQQQSTESSEDDSEEGVAIFGPKFGNRDGDGSEDHGSEDSFGVNETDDYDELVGGNDDPADDSIIMDTSSHVRRPDSFSRIDPTMPSADLQREHPAFTRCQECIVTLKPGQALYLPASWFHCVTSLANTSETAGPNPVHLALNYWYYPPDQCDNFENPYRYEG